ncbi:carboxylate-amine ligase Isop_0121 [Candidatus Scalindua japonica]|uniref:Putative glutamate--cysteine ligase 2 n=1 Tax=Candidatus Scalindua japonica TaxID=1284222 RepID=A0A286U2P9_9BACT|nr:YbdK family carboxylate-amine ligase [Candidatus Scalindua japonica]GAX62418.1 carboxylate-amine ligase Isop_0121 [Candidatus Scalindua japonica]
MKPFKRNDFPTLGIEEELHLIDQETAELTPTVNEVMALLEPDFRERVCYELLQCVLETRTGVYETVDELLRETSNGRTILADCCSKLNVNIVAAGSHPFSDWKKQPFVDSEHYQWVRNNCRYIAHRMLSFGLHIHVGVKNAEAAIYIMNEMRRWAYPLLALSANSPYYDGVDTGLVSTRAHLFHSMPRTKFAPPFKSFAELIDFYEKFLAAGDIRQPGDLWWIIRPQPPLGTVEFRIFDIPTSVRRIGAFAALIQAAVDTYQDRFFAGIPISSLNEGYLEENWWKAIRYGINTDMIEPETGEIISISDQLKRLIGLTVPKAKELHAEHHINFAEKMIEQGSEAKIQRALCKKLNGDLRALEKELAVKTVDFSGQNYQAKYE